MATLAYGNGKVAILLSSGKRQWHYILTAIISCSGTIKKKKKGKRKEKETKHMHAKKIQVEPAEVTPFQCL